MDSVEQIILICLKKYIPKNIYYTLNPWLRNLNTDFVKLIKNADSDK